MTLARQIRSAVNSAVLNPATTRLLDWAFPVNTLGGLGELEAERFLLRRGFIIVARQHSNSYGEIDLIAVDDRTVVFVEVKTRRSDAAGTAAEAVDLKKQTRITRTALAYLRRHDLLECSARFDVIAITWPEMNAKPQIDHFTNAFEPTGQFQMHS